MPGLRALDLRRARLSRQPLARAPSVGRHPRRPFPGQRLLLGDTLVGPHRFLLRLQRRARPMTSPSASTPGASSPIRRSTSRKGRALLKGYQIGASADAGGTRGAAGALGAARRCAFSSRAPMTGCTTEKDALGEAARPVDFVKRLRFHQSVRSARELRLSRTWHERRDGRYRHLYRRRLLGKSWRRRLGRDPLISVSTARRSTAAKLTSTNNRMELMAAISALEALKRPSRVALAYRQPIREERHHGSGSTAGSGTAGKRPTRSR